MVVSDGYEEALRESMTSLKLGVFQAFFSEGILKIIVAKSCGRNVVEHALEIFCKSLFLSGTSMPSFNCGNISMNDPLV